MDTKISLTPIHGLKQFRLEQLRTETEYMETPLQKSRDKLQSRIKPSSETSRNVFELERTKAT